MPDFCSDPTFLSDADVAQALRMSKEWVRVQRHKRRKGADHFLTLDPVMVGSKPRYLAEDVEAFMAALSTKREVR